MVKSLFWKLGFAALACQSGVQAVQQYVLDDNYSNFFDSFDFWTAADPTNGYVDYVDEATARSLGIVDDSSSSVKFGVEYKNNYPTGGRPSVRIQSKAIYNKGLVIADIKHMPGGICGTWPAFWMNGPNWPDTGEIDIMEGVNLNTNNLMVLHTDSTPGCTINGNGQTGTTTTFNCDTTTNTQPSNAGCAVSANSDNTYGAGFNKAGGGVYATEWTSSWIRIWFFPRGSIPADITAGIPNPSTWGTPSANFQGSCDIDAHFSNLQIIFDTTLCGDWAGNVWANSGCSSNTYQTCQSFVANPPSKETFKDAYWEVNSLKVYQLESVTTTSTTYSSTKSSTSTSTSTSKSSTTSSTSKSSTTSSYTPSSTSTTKSSTTSTYESSSTLTSKSSTTSSYAPSSTSTTKSSTTSTYGSSSTSTSKSSTTSSYAPTSTSTTKSSTTSTYGSSSTSTSKPSTTSSYAPSSTSTSKSSTTSTYGSPSTSTYGSSSSSTLKSSSTSTYGSSSTLTSKSSTTPTYGSSTSKSSTTSTYGSSSTLTSQYSTSSTYGSSSTSTSKAPTTSSYGSSSTSTSKAPTTSTYGSSSTSTSTYGSSSTLTSKSSTSSTYGSSSTPATSSYGSSTSQPSSASTYEPSSSTGTSTYKPGTSETNAPAASSSSAYPTTTAAPATSNYGTITKGITITTTVCPAETIWYCQATSVTYGAY